MRQGASPQEACYEAVQRIIRSMPTDDLQVGYLAWVATVKLEATPFTVGSIMLFTSERSRKGPFNGF